MATWSSDYLPTNLTLCQAAFFLGWFLARLSLCQALCLPACLLFCLPARLSAFRSDHPPDWIYAGLFFSSMSVVGLHFVSIKVFMSACTHLCVLACSTFVVVPSWLSLHAFLSVFLLALYCICPPLHLFFACPNVCHLHATLFVCRSPVFYLQ